MPNLEFVKNYIARAAIPARTIVKWGAADYEVLPAAAATDHIIGISADLDTDSGDRCDVIHEGIALVKLGGAVTRGDLITSDAGGLAIKAVPGAGVRIIGEAVETGVANDLVNVLLAKTGVYSA